MPQPFANYMLDETAKYNLEKLALIVRKMDELIDRFIEIATVEGKLSDEQFVAISLFRKCLEKANAIYAISEEGVEASVEITLRNLFEVYLNSCYLLENDSTFKKRAYRYYFFTLKAQLDSIKLFIGNTKDAKLVQENMNLSEEDKFNFTKKRKEIYVRLATSSGLDLANMEHEKHYEDQGHKFSLKKGLSIGKGSKKINHPQWYSLNNGPKNLRFLAKEFNMEPEYLVLYSAWSREVHGVNALDNVIEVRDEGDPFMKDVTEYQSIGFLLNQACSFSVRVLLLFSSFYFNRGEKEELRNWYEEKIRLDN
ncbi:DUF5677 domain-containing protein [Geomicrobium sp. JCM 19039]|uniref:DUF5677 domain-containing protein n=1 Tax=Geomicrobium sp. JCM 19039 TaxID=1460636 RepID=UPI001267E5CE|nr:DUF5677 domain-containing protein [Geomicrobium sp. JCM 19039]